MKLKLTEWRLNQRLLLFFSLKGFFRWKPKLFRSSNRMIWNRIQDILRIKNVLQKCILFLKTLFYAFMLIYVLLFFFSSFFLTLKVSNFYATFIAQCLVQCLLVSVICYFYIILLKTEEINKVSACEVNTLLLLPYHWRRWLKAQQVKEISQLGHHLQFSFSSKKFPYISYHEHCK